jgi:hypothetical protein
MPNHSETELILKVLYSFSDVSSTPKPLTSDIAEKHPIDAVLTLLRGHWFQSVVGYFVNHRPSNSYAHIDDEYKVQDLLYCLLITALDDLQYEDPAGKSKGALTSTRLDLVSKRQGLIIEAKYASSKHLAKDIESEISEDIVKYGKLSDFNTMIFFIYCSDYTFPNQKEFELGFTDRHEIAGHKFQTYCIIKP